MMKEHSINRRRCFRNLQPIRSGSLRYFRPISLLHLRHPGDDKAGAGSASPVNMFGTLYKGQKPRVERQCNAYVAGHFKMVSHCNSLKLDAGDSRTLKVF